MEPPPGVTPAFLSGTTMEVFKLTGLPENAPYTRVNVAEILKDIQFKGVISDWQPFTKIIKAYKEEGVAAGDLTILVVQDTEMIYDQNFYFCHTHEAAIAIVEMFEKGPAVAGGEEGGEGEGEGAAAEEEEEEVRPREIEDPDPVNRPWVEWTQEEGTGVKTSDEIEEFQTKDEDPVQLRFSMSRKRRLFRQNTPHVGIARFFDAESVETEDFKPYRDPQFKEQVEMGPGVYGTRFLLRDKASNCVPV
ncbi:hypothetical protein T484DRAFT_2751222, partial [Baffinella frigidus]